MNTALRRIDVHHHYFPTAWVEAASKDPRTPPMPPDWTIEKDLAIMDELGIGTSMLSVTAPGIWFDDAAQAVALARDINDQTADVVRTHPTRYGNFACLPLPNVDAACTEAVRALDELGADGIGVLTSAGLQYVSDEATRPLWKILDERSAVLFIHPTNAPALHGETPAHFFVDACVEFPAETTRAAIGLVQNRFLRDYPNVTVVLSHAGGFLPYQSGRFESLASFLPGLDRTEVAEDLRSFWFDTALTATSTTMAGLLEFARPERVVYGTDIPASPVPIAQKFTQDLDAILEGRGEGRRIQEVQYENVLRVLPRLAARLGPAERRTAEEQA